MANDKDLLENLFQSIDVIIGSRLNNLGYDKTELCTIEEVKGNNAYYVSNGSAKYVAYAQNDAIYDERDSVYVTIPGSDYNNQKLIVGKHTAGKSSSKDWVSPMENFVNITGNIVNIKENKFGLIANNVKENVSVDDQAGYAIVKIWEDDATIPYTQYDRLCISADFSNDLTEQMVIDGNYGLFLIGDIKDPQLQRELDELDRKLKNHEISKEKYETEVKKAKKKYQNVDNKLFLIFDSADMIGNPYDFTVPYTQEKMFEITRTSEISNLQLYFYQGLTDTLEFKNNFYGINNKLIKKEESNNLFVENISINFGYGFDEYKSETAILYTLDSLNYEVDAEDPEKKINRDLLLRWVHFDDKKQAHNIRDLEHKSLDGHYAKIHWYHYDLTSEKEYKDNLAGYFWKEIESAQNKFSCPVEIQPGWKTDKFKVIIEYDDKVIKSEELVFKNLKGGLEDTLITGINILYPNDDQYKGKFYLYGADYISTTDLTKPFFLLVDFKTLDGDTEYWTSEDIICWKFPSNHTMILTPEDGEEYDTSNGDIFLKAGTKEKATVGGIEFKALEDKHLVIRKVKVETDPKDNKKKDTRTSRLQGYRISRNYLGSAAINNSIACEVFKPSIGKSVENSIEFSFGLHTTNGTKYTLIVNWQEYLNKYRNSNKPEPEKNTPYAMTCNNGDDNDTWKWVFSCSVFDVNQKEVEAPEGGWVFKLSWYEDRIAGPDENNKNIDNFFIINNNELIIKEDSYQYLLNHCQYQILQVQITNFDYRLTTRIPIPIRRDRSIKGFLGPDRITYDASGYNPRWNDRKYDVILDEHITIPNLTWGIKNTWQERDKNNFEKAITSMPRLEQPKDKDGNLINEHYLVAPDTYLPIGGEKYEGVCVFIKSGDTIYWLQPLYITRDAYGSSFLNEWDGSMQINEDENTILASTIGAGKKDLENRFSGVVLGELKKVTEDKDTVEKEGILGFHEGEVSFGLLNDGTATLGKSGHGQIQFNGINGYIMSGNFNGFGDKAGTLPTFGDNGMETDEVWNNVKNKKDSITGAYLGLSSGRAWFGGDVGVSGTIYSSEGNIGGWTINETSIFAKNNDNYTVLKSDGTVGLAFGVSPDKWEKEGTTTLAKAQFYHNGKIRLGHDGSDGNNDINYSVVIDPSANPIAAFRGTIYATAGEIGGCFIKDGKLEIPVANISGKLTASNIDATNLKVDAANITGKLEAKQIKVEDINIKAAQITSGTISNAMIGDLSADKIKTGTLTLTGTTANATNVIKFGKNGSKGSIRGHNNDIGIYVDNTLRTLNFYATHIYKDIEEKYYELSAEGYIPIQIVDKDNSSKILIDGKLICTSSKIIAYFN